MPTVSIPRLLISFTQCITSPGTRGMVWGQWEAKSDYMYTKIRAVISVLTKNYTANVHNGCTVEPLCIQHWGKKFCPYNRGYMAISQGLRTQQSGLDRWGVLMSNMAFMRTYYWTFF